MEKDIAAFMKKEFDKKYGPTWHCVVGRNFGSYVTHESGNFIYMYISNVAFCYSRRDERASRTEENRGMNEGNERIVNRGVTRRVRGSLSVERIFVISTTRALHS